MLAGSTAWAELTKDEAKARKELTKQSRKQLNEKASKDARKAAKQYKKAGWITSPGALPIEKQLDRAYLMQMEYDNDGMPSYLRGEGQSVGENYDAAKNSAIMMAKMNIMQQVETAMTGINEIESANEQKSDGNVTSLQKTFTVAKGALTQKLGRVQPVVECYRELKNGKKEVLVQVYYSAKAVREGVQEAARQTLGEKAAEYEKQIDEMLGL